MFAEFGIDTWSVFSGGLRIRKLLKIKLMKLGSTGHKIYIRHKPLNVNSVHRLDIKYLEKY